jgi:hypothetical protein
MEQTPRNLARPANTYQPYAFLLLLYGCQPFRHVRPDIESDMSKMAQFVPVRSNKRVAKSEAGNRRRFFRQPDTFGHGSMAGPGPAKSRIP